MKSLHMLLLFALISFSVSLSSCITESNKEEEVIVSSEKDSSAKDAIKEAPETTRPEPTTSTGNGAAEPGVGTTATNAAPFMEKALRSHQQDIHIAGLAESKGTNADIKNLARALRVDHQQLLDELKAISGNAPSGPAQGKEVSELEKLKEVSFDEAWKSTMLKQQESLINTYTIQLGKENDPVLQAHLNKAITVLRSNRQKMVEFLSK